MPNGAILLESGSKKTEGLCVRLLKRYCLYCILVLENHSPQSRGAVRNPLQSALDVLENLAFSGIRALQHVALRRPNRLFRRSGMSRYL